MENEAPVAIGFLIFGVLGLGGMWLRDKIRRKR